MTDVVDGRAAGKDESIARGQPHQRQLAGERSTLCGRGNTRPVLPVCEYQIVTVMSQYFVAGGTRGQFYQCVSIRLSPLCPSTRHAFNSNKESIAVER